MKRYLLLYAILTGFILTGFLLSVTVRYQPVHSDIDAVTVNEIVQQTSLHWDDLEQLKEANFSYRFFILDHGGEILYTSDDDPLFVMDELYTAVHRGFLPMSIEINGRMAGRVLIETSPNNHTQQAYAYLSTIIMIAFLLLFVLNAIFFTVLYRIIIRPFRRIERFAHRISAGMLDEPLPISRNNIFGLFTHAFDVMRASLLEARQKQHAAEQAHKELIAALSHDIKTPVTSIKLIAELLQVYIDDPNAKEKLTTIEMKAGQIDRLMNDLLHSTLEELGELQVTLASTESSVLLELFKSADHFSKVRIGHVPPCLVEIDVMRMEQVIGNIIHNSYKYAGTAIDIVFSLYGEGLQVDINDYGQGVETDELELITAKFYRGQNAKVSQKEGEGLGLYIAKQLMGKMGGELETINRSDGFTIRLWMKLS